LWAKPSALRTGQVRKSATDYGGKLPCKGSLFPYTIDLYAI